MKLPLLYNRATGDRVTHWTLEVVGDKYRSVYGWVGSNTVTENAWSTAEPTNVGKKNERAGPAQALFEAKAHWKKHVERGYCEDISKIDEHNTAGLEVMLALSLDDFLTGKKAIDFKKGLGVQNKYNGVRCSAQWVNGRVVLMSRGHKEWVSVPHINRSLTEFFQLHPDAKLDGELYNFDYRLKLNELNSICRNQSPNAEELALAESVIEYHVYDGYDFGPNLDQDAPYSERKKFIDEILPRYSKYVKYVQTWIVYSLAELEKLYQTFIDRGDEGAIVRVMTGGYESGRSRNLFKYKPEDDDEGVIDEIEEGDGPWLGAAKAVWILWKDKRFKGTFMGKRDPVCRDIFTNQKKWIGRRVTFKFTGLTGLGTPNYARIDPANCTPST